MSYNNRDSITSKTRLKPSAYKPIPFHAIRAVSFVSSLIVASILGFFCGQLVSEGYKIPWTFIIVLIAAIVNLLAIVLTAIIGCCATLAPLFNILINIPLLFLWVFGICILTWNMYGALGHSCTIANWGNSRGVMICNVYKLLYAFVVFANLSHIAQLVLDVRARRQQVRLGKYDKMRDSRDIKPNDINTLAAPTVHDTPLASSTSLNQQQFRDDQYQPEQQQQYQHEQQHYPYDQQQYEQQSHYQDYAQDTRDEVPGWRPGQRPTPSHSYNSQSSSTSYRHNNHYGYQDSSSSLQMQDLSYQRSQQPTNYDAGNYNVGGYGYQQQHTYYQGRY